jgi:transposase
MIQSSLPREDEMAELFWFSDEQWALIEPLLPTDTRGLKRVDDRRVLSGIVHVLYSGCHWSHCPPEYGPAKTIYNRFVRWTRRGIWERIFATLTRREGPPDRLMIDSTIVRAHRSSAGGKGGPRIRPLAAVSAAGPPKSTS